MTSRSTSNAWEPIATSSGNNHSTRRGGITSLRSAPTLKRCNNKKMNLLYRFKTIPVVLLALFAMGSNVLSDDKSPKTPAELLKFLRNSMWTLQSDEHPRFGNGILIFRKNGIIEHIYENDEVERKSWGVTDNLKVVWGGGYLRVITFSDDYKSFTDSKFATMGKRITEHKRGKSKKD